jgi:hypothetical protein
MRYRRVLPRDLFNEANLLKCYGKLWILFEGDPSSGFEEADAPMFDIMQDASDGSLTVANLHFRINGQRYHLSRPLNSRHDWPLYATPENGDSIPVFDDAGELSDEVEALRA